MSCFRVIGKEGNAASDHGALTGVLGDGAYHISLEHLDYLRRQTFLKPDFTALAIQGQSTTNEVGYTMPGGQQTFTFGVENSGNIVPNSVEVFKDATQLDNNLQPTGSLLVDIGAAIQRNTIGSVLFSVRATDLLGDPVSDTLAIYWYARIYYGVSTLEALATEAQVKALGASYLDNNRGRTGLAFNNANHFSYLAMPVLINQSGIQFKDALSGGLFDYGMLPQNEVGAGAAQINVTNEHGLTLAYAIYRSGNLLANPTLMDVI